MIQLTFTLTTPEIIRLTRDKQLRWVRRLYWPAGIVFVLMMGMGILLGKWEGLLMFGLPMLLIIGIYEWRFPKLMERQLQKLPSWGKPVTFMFSEAHIHQKSANGEATLQWQGITKAEELPDWFLLHLGPKMMYLTIPKRAFDHQSEQEKFKNLLIQKRLISEYNQ